MSKVIGRTKVGGHEVRCDGEWHTWWGGAKETEPYAQKCDCSGKVDHTSERLMALAHRLGAAYTMEQFDSSRQPEAFRLAQKLLAGGIPGLYLYGPTGTGKTHLAKAILYESLRRDGSKVEFIQAPFLARLFASSQGYGEEAVDATKMLDRLLDCAVVVIDDLGSQRTTESGVFAEQFQLFLEGYKGKLVITSNLNFKDLEESVGKKNASRISERSVGQFMGGKDVRKERAKELGTHAKEDADGGQGHPGVAETPSRSHQEAVHGEPLPPGPHGAVDEPRRRIEFGG